MIIKICQTASNIRQTYDIDGENFHYTGKVGSIKCYQPISFYNENTTIDGFFKLSKWSNYIPFRWLVGKENLRQRFQLYKNKELYGNIVLSKHGFYKSSYIITSDSGEIFHCYYRTKGSFDYVSIYHNNSQVALLETFLSVNDFKFTHKLYILDSYSKFAEILSFFVLYYANFMFVKRLHMSKGSFYGYAWSFSRYNNMYNEKWRETHFPDENFFGKTNLFSK